MSFGYNASVVRVSGLLNTIRDHSNSLETLLTNKRERDSTARIPPPSVVPQLTLAIEHSSDHVCRPQSRRACAGRGMTIKSKRNEGTY